MPLREHVDFARRERFSRLFTEVYEPLQRYVRRRAEAAAVDDVVADTLLVLWRRLDDVPADNELAWCYGTARRCLANHRRAGERRDRLVDRVASEAVDGAIDDPAGDPDLSSALAELSADERELVRLWAWEQLAPKEIAVVLGITPNAASIRLQRAKKRLADRLAERKETGLAGHTPGGDLNGSREEGA